MATSAGSRDAEALPDRAAPTDLANLELTEGQMRQMAHAVVERVVAHIGSLEQQPVFDALEDAEALSRSLREPPPETGMELEALLDPLLDVWVPRSFNCASPGYLAYVPGGGLFPAALADFIADGVNRFTGVWNAAPALVQLEANVLAWFRDWMQFPEGTRGLLTSGGSMATFSALVAARDKLLGAELRRGVLYTSTQAHHCVAKAAHLAGILPDRIRPIAIDEHFRMRTDALEDSILRDRQAGLLPFVVVSAAGTTNTGAIDPLDKIADICQREQLWHHCDGAYGGFFHMCPALRPLLSGLSRADSLTLDPHKGLFLPYGTGALLVRDGAALGAAHQGFASYLPPLPGDDFYNPSQLSPELSRPYRGLRVWLALKLFGSRRFVAALQEKRALALACAEEMAAIDGIELVGAPELSLFAFRFRDDNDATRALLDRVNRKGRVMLTGCSIDGRFYGRVCVLCFRTRQRHIEHCLEDMRQAAAEP